MSVNIEIRDGTPYWYLSPDIWVVPGSDPNGPLGPPIAGQPAYVWAHVENKGSDIARGVRIDFWWADPSGQIMRSTAHRIGSAFVDLGPAGSSDATQEVLCLTPWQVKLVNNGHECLVVEAIYPGSSVPSPAPEDFGPPAYPEIAQRNIAVVSGVGGKPMHVLTIAAGKRKGKTVTVTAEAGGRLDEALLKRMGLGGLKAAGVDKLEVGLSREPAFVPPDGALGPRMLDLEIAAGTRKPVCVAVRAGNLTTKEYGVINVVERHGDRIVGGYALIATNSKRKRVP